MRCTIDHGSSEIRRLVGNLEHAWINIHTFQVDESQAARASKCIGWVSVSDESRIWHYLMYHLSEFLTELPQDMRFGFRGLAHGVRGSWVRN